MMLCFVLRWKWNSKMTIWNFISEFWFFFKFPLKGCKWAGEGAPCSELCHVAAHFPALLPTSHQQPHNSVFTRGLPNCLQLSFVMEPMHKQLKACWYRPTTCVWPVPLCALLLPHVLLPLGLLQVMEAIRASRWGQQCCRRPRCYTGQIISSATQHYQVAQKVSCKQLLDISAVTRTQRKQPFMNNNEEIISDTFNGTISTRQTY